jgi:hypothetical protein
LHVFNNCSSRLDRITVALSLKITTLQWEALDNLSAGMEFQHLREVTSKLYPGTGREREDEGDQVAELSFPKLRS